MPNPDIIEPTRYQCRHIFTDGHRCGSPSLRQEDFCYYHHNTRRPAPRCPQDATPRGRRSSSLTLQNPEDRSAIQHSIGLVLQKLANNELDARRAGLLLYGLQIASLNLPKTKPNTRETEPDIIEDFTIDPVLGPMAPTAEVDENKPKSTLDLLIEEMEALPDIYPAQEDAQRFDPLLSLQAAAGAPEIATQAPKSRPKFCSPKTLPEKYREGRAAHPHRLRRTVTLRDGPLSKGLTHGPRHAPAVPQ